jgi:hypothetical protein
MALAIPAALAVRLSWSDQRGNTRTTRLEEGARNSRCQQPKAARNEIEIIDAEKIDASKRLNPALSAYFEDYRLFHSEIGPFFQT